MKKSRSVTLALVGSALLASGCGGSSSSRKFYDKAGNPVPRSQWKKADGSPAELYDANGNPVAADEINRVYSTSSSTATGRTYGHSGGWFWGGSGWGSSSRGYSGGSSSGGVPSGGSVSRGGFGGTGHSMGGGSSAS